MRVISIGELFNGWGLVLKIQLCLSLLTQDASQFPEYMDREVNPDFDFDDLHYLDIEQSDLNDPPSPSNEGLLSSHPHTPSIISQQSIHPPSTPGLDAARASQIHVMGCLEHHGLMQLDLPVSPLSGADPDDPDDHGNDDPPSQPSPSPPHTPPPVQNPDPSQPSPSPPHIPPPVQNVQHGRPPAPWQKKATFDDCAFLQPYGAESDNFYQQLNLGHMSYKCNHCGALHWLEEHIAKSSKAKPKFGQCCNHGKVLLPLLIQPPCYLELLLGSCQDILGHPFQFSDVQQERCRHFHQHIRMYNAAFAFVSLGYKRDEQVSNQGGPPVFKIRGMLSHNHGALLPEVCPNIQVLNHYNRLNSNYPFFRMMITAMFMHKCTSMMEPGVLIQPILLALQTIQELDLIS